MKLTATFSILCILSLFIFVQASVAASATHNGNLHRVGIATSQSSMDTSKDTLTKTNVRMDKRLSCVLSNKDKTSARIKSTSDGNHIADQQVC